ncbi:MAG: hypothetical protein PG981_000104 [Wolbachia endosymbiont of Ctenocephalides orientis wCori]|nr:MAG: hypothetical protein PG981_000104 [Wolbachia endosymbiont of Ctenocephalides orientis wCori]
MGSYFSFIFSSDEEEEDSQQPQSEESVSSPTSLDAFVDNGDYNGPNVDLE